MRENDDRLIWLPNTGPICFKCRKDVVMRHWPAVEAIVDNGDQRGYAIQRDTPYDQVEEIRADLEAIPAHDAPPEEHRHDTCDKKRREHVEMNATYALERAFTEAYRAGVDEERIDAIIARVRARARHGVLYARR